MDYAIPLCCLRSEQLKPYTSAGIIQICEEVIQINNPDTGHILCVPQCCVEFYISQEPLWIVFCSVLDFTVAGSDAEQLNDWLVELA